MSSNPIRRILYPIQDNPACHAFTPQVIEVARRFGATIEFLHVVPTRREIRAGEAFLAGYTRPGVPVRCRVASGAVIPNLFAALGAEPDTLIMLPARALPFWRRWTKRSMVAEIVRSSPVPVWTSWGGAPPPDGEFRRVAAAVDLHSLSRQILLESASFAARLGAELDIFHAVPFVDVDALSACSLQDLPVALSPDSARSGIDRLLRISGVPASVHIGQGEPAEVLPSLARRHQAGLLILGVGRRCPGENVMATIRAARCPVLILPQLRPSPAPQPATSRPPALTCEV
jgi:nucleotide-binding universal stress UspA family protein